jgi:hypothetical protein
MAHASPVRKSDGVFVAVDDDSIQGLPPTARASWPSWWFVFGFGFLLCAYVASLALLEFISPGILLLMFLLLILDTWLNT